MTDRVMRKKKSSNDYSNRSYRCPLYNNFNLTAIFFACTRAAITRGVKILSNTAVAARELG